MLDNLQRETFAYFVRETDPVTGLVVDQTKPGFPASIAATGMGITACIVGVERGFISRQDAVEYTFKVLCFFYNSRQDETPEATGYKGFYYHFLDMATGKRAWDSELSTVDSAFLFAGFLTAAAYFKREDPRESSIRQMANQLYERADWKWALNNGDSLSHGWKPGTGFIRYRWNRNYSEALLLYILALGSPGFSIDAGKFTNWTSSFEISRVYDRDCLYAGPLFIHQYSHMWIDFNGINDDFNRRAGFDYFENSRRAVYIHRRYAMEHPGSKAFTGLYGWGLSAGDGPGVSTRKTGGQRRKFYDYKARGAPYGPDDGTICPWAMIASLPFCPDLVSASIDQCNEQWLRQFDVPFNFSLSYNPEFIINKEGEGWKSRYLFALKQAPMLVMIENFRSGLIWSLMKECPPIVAGLKKAGFNGAWLNS